MLPKAHRTDSALKNVLPVSILDFMKMLRRLLPVLALGWLGLEPSAAYGQNTYTWSQTTSGNWSTATWNPTGPPVGSTTTTIEFGGSTSYTATLDLTSPFLLNSLNFTNTSAADTVTVNSAAGEILQFTGAAPSLLQNGASLVNVQSLIELDGNLAVGGTGTGAITLNSLRGFGAANRTLTASGASLLTIGSLQISNDAAARTFTIGGASNVLITGVVSNGSATTGNLAYTGTGTLTLAGTSTYSGTTSVTGRGTLNLDFSVANAPSGSNLVPATSPLVIGAGGGSGSKLQVVGANGGGSASSSTQTFAGTTFNVGKSTITAISGTGNVGDSVTLDLGALVRGGATSTLGRGVAVRFDLPANGSILTTSGTASSILLSGISGATTPYATVGASDWAAKDATNTKIVALPAGSYTLTTAGNPTAATNVDVAAGVTLTTLTANRAITSLRFNQPQATTIALGNFNLQTPGVLVTPNVGANTSTITGTGTGLFNQFSGGGANNDIIIHQNNTLGDLVLSAPLANGISLTKAGPGRFIWTANSAFNQTIFISEGILQLGNGATSFGLAGGSIQNRASLVLKQAGTTTLSQAISQTGTLSVDQGTWVLTGNNTFSGATTVASGTTLQIGAGSTTGTLANSVATVAGILTFNRSDALTHAPGIDGTGIVQQNGAGDLTLAGALTGSLQLVNNTASNIIIASNANTFTGGTTISAGGTVQVGNAGTTGVLTGNVSNFGALVFNRTNNSTFAGNITGTGTLAKTGTGLLLTLTGTGNSFTGNTSVTAGTLRIGNGGSNGSLPASNVSIATGAGLEVNTASNITLGGNLSATGTGTFTNSGSGIVTLTGTNTLPVVAANAGILRVKPGTLGSAAATVADGATLSAFNATSSVVLNALTLGATTGGALRFETDGSPSVALFNVTNTDGFIVNGTSTLNIVNGATPLSIGTFPLLSYAGTVGGAGLPGLALGVVPSRVVASLDTATAGLVQLNIAGIDTITWTGLVGGSPNGNWDIGTVQPDGYSPLTGNANWKQTIGGQTTVYLQPSVPGDAVTFDGTAAGTKIVNLTTTLSPASVTVNTSGGDYTFTGTGSLAGGTSLVKQGAGTLFITNSGTNTFTGGLNVTGGSLRLGDGSVSSTLPGNIALATGTSLELQPGVAGVTIAGNITGAGSLLILGSNTSTLTGSGNNYSGGTTVNAGATLRLGNGTTTGVLPGNALNNGTVLFNPAGAGVTYAGDISGTGAVNVQGNTIFTGSGNTYAGGTTITSGTLQIGDGTSTGSLPGSVTNNGTLAFRPGISGLSFGGVISGSGAVQVLANTVTLTNTNTYLGTTTVSNNAVLAISSDANLGATANTLTLLNSTLLATTTFTLDAARSINLGAGGGKFDVPTSQTLTVAGGVSGSSTSLTKLGAGVLLLNTAATYTGPTTISAGTLRYGTTNTLPIATNVTISSGATLDLNNSNGTIAQLNGAGDVTLGTGTLTVSGAGTFNGVISGGGGLAKTGGTTLILGASSNYTGTTSIDGNNTQIRIAVNNALPTATNLRVGVTAGNTNRIFDLNGFNQEVAQLNSVVNATGSAFVQNDSPSATALTAPAVLTITNGGAFSSNNAAVNAIIRDNSGGGLLGRVAIAVTTGGTLTLNTANSYTGGTSISGGTIALRTTGKLGTGTITLGTGSLTAVNGQTPTVDNPIILAGDATVGGGDATSTLTLNGVISGTGSLTKSNASTVILSAASSYNGLTRINNGSIRLGIDNALPAATSLFLGNAAGTNNGTVDLNGFDLQVALLERTSDNTGTAQRVQNLSATAGTLTVNYSGPTPSAYVGFIGGTLGDNLDLVKSGTGTFILNQANTYANGTTVASGILVATNTTGSATGTGNLTVQLNATLTGTGIVTGQAILDGGNLLGGTGGSLASANTITVGSGLLNSGSVLQTIVGDSNPGNGFSEPQASLINFGTGALTKGTGGPYTLRLTSDTPLEIGQSYTVTIATYGSLGGGLSSSDFTLDASNFTIEPGWTINAGSSMMTATFTVTPEPVAMGLMGAVVLGLIRWRRWPRWTARIKNLTAELSQ